MKMQIRLSMQVWLLPFLIAAFGCQTKPVCAERIGVGDFDPPRSIEKSPPTLNNNYLQPQSVPKFFHVVDYGPDFYVPGNGPVPLQKMIDTEPDEPVSKPPLGTDSEHSAAMLKLWDAWHARVAQVIYERFNRSAQALFKHSPPLDCQVSYMVASDGRIGNVRILRSSQNVTFNTMLLTVIKSIAGNEVLAFPPGSKRQFVEKTGTFTWNYAGGCDTSPAAPPQIGPRPVSK